MFNQNLNRIATNFGLPALVFVSTMGLGIAAPGSISVSVTNASATPNPALRPATQETVSATISAGFHSDSGPTLVTGQCQGKKRTNTTTTISYTQKTLSATANGFSMNGVNGGVFTAALALGADGRIDVSISASASEVETTTVVIDSYTYSGNQCTGTETLASGSPSTTTKTLTGSASASTSFVTDLAPPVLTLDPDQAQPTVQQGGTKNVHNRLEEGAPGSPYTIIDTLTGPGGYTTTAQGLGSFGPQGKAVDLVGAHIACDAPLGQYTASATAETVDLGNNPFPTISSPTVDTFTVVPGATLQDQTFVVSNTPNGYNTMSCFSAATSGRKISTNPGSFHIAAVVNTTGRCSGVNSLTGTIVKLSLPPGFSFNTTGNSPAAHVFIVDATNGFDYHYPGPEVVVPKSAIMGASGSELTVNLSGVSVNGGPAGVIPANTTIYVRAHVAFTGTSIPADGTVYPFSTSTSANLSGVASQATGNWTLTKSASCSNGN